MSENNRKRTADTELSREEANAQAWHKKRHTGEAASPCWCCCALCRVGNPHDTDARRAAITDIFARIADSLATTRLPKPPASEWS